MTCGIQITFLVYHYTFDNIYVCEWTLFLWQGMSTKKIMAHIFINNLKYSVGNFFWKKNVSCWISTYISLQFSNIISLVVYNSFDIYYSITLYLNIQYQGSEFWSNHKVTIKMYDTTAVYNFANTCWFIPAGIYLCILLQIHVVIVSQYGCHVSYYFMKFASHFIPHNSVMNSILKRACC